MDRAYTLAQAESWDRMSEAAQHAWHRRNDSRHYNNCDLCQKHLLPDGRPRPKD